MDKEVLIALLAFGGAVIPALVGLAAKDRAGVGRRVSLLQWVLFTTLATGAVAVFFYDFEQVGPGVEVFGAEMPVIARNVFAAGMIGCAQWLALHLAGLNPRLWVIATVVGCIPLTIFWGEDIAWPLFGALVGTMQALLCARTVQRALPWIVMNALAWGLAGPIWPDIAAIVKPIVGPAFAAIIGVTSIGTIAGLISGVLLRTAISDPSAGDAEKAP